MSSLFEINKNLQLLYEQAVDEETGEVVNENLFQYIDELSLERTEKIENIACWIKDLNAEEDAIKNEIKALQERAKHKSNKAENLKRYLMYALHGEKFETTKCAINWRKTKSVECTLDDITKLPDQFLRYKEPELNKTEIKKFIQDGGTVEGCQIIEKYSMGIK